MKAELTLPERPAVVHLLAVLDILVLVLVFFLLLTSITQESGFLVKMPESSFRLRSYGKPIVVTVRNGAVPVIYIWQERIAMEDLEEKLVQGAEERGAETMILYADETLSYGVVNEIVETGLKLGLNVAQAGRQAGVEQESNQEGEASLAPLTPTTDEKTEP